MEEKIGFQGVKMSKLQIGKNVLEEERGDWAKCEQNSNVVNFFKILKFALDFSVFCVTL